MRRRLIGTLVVCFALAAPQAAVAEVEAPFGLAMWWEDVGWPAVGASGGLGLHATDPSNDFGISGDANVLAFDVARSGRRLTQEIEIAFSGVTGDWESVVLRMRGRTRSLELSKPDAGIVEVCGRWTVRWRILDPHPLQQRFKAEGQPAIVPRGRGTFAACVTWDVAGHRMIDSSASFSTPIRARR